MMIKIGDSTLEVGDNCVYLGQTVQLGRSNFEKEVNRQNRLFWETYGKLRGIFSSNLPQCLKTNVYDQRVLPVQCIVLLICKM